MQSPAVTPVLWMRPLIQDTQILGTGGKYRDKRTTNYLEPGASYRECKGSNHTQALEPEALKTPLSHYTI